MSQSSNKPFGYIFRSTIDHEALGKKDKPNVYGDLKKQTRYGIKALSEDNYV